MTNQDDWFRRDCCEGLPQKPSLARSSPNYPLRAAAIPETGPVERNDAVALRCESEHSAQFEILIGDAIAMKHTTGGPSPRSR